MVVYLNGEAKTLEQSLSVQKLLEQVGIEQTKGVAVAINNHVIPKANWPSQLVEDEDQVMVITATAGG